MTTTTRILTVCALVLGAAGCAGGGTGTTASTRVSAQSSATTHAPSPSSTPPATSSSASVSAPGSVCGGSGRLLCVAVTLSGGTPVVGSTLADTTGPTGKATSCAQVVAGTPATFGAQPSFRVPLSIGTSQVGSHDIQVHVDVKGGYFNGPGTYATPTLDTSSDLVLDSVFYHPGPTTTGTVTVAADGSGSLTFTDLVDQTGTKESGRITWTCGS